VDVGGAVFAAPHDQGHIGSAFPIDPHEVSAHAPRQKIPEDYLASMPSEEAHGHCLHPMGGQQHRDVNTLPSRRGQGLLRANDEPFLDQTELRKPIELKPD